RDAVEHADEDVTVRIGRSSTTLFVEDDDPGIADGAHDRAFEHGHTTSESGTGFGLSIVETIADAHGWAVTAEEGTNGGARFEL
ncbi:MAG: hypothetical protein BRD21_00005, partial [Halobacteriales archaeon SW_8_66_22]